MENTHVFRILTLCVVALAVTAEPTIRLETDADEVEQGTSFSFTCVVKDLVGGTSFLRLQKVPVGVQNPVPFILTTNAIKSNDIKENDRYSVKYEPGDAQGELKFIFTVDGALHGDSGEYYCMVMGSDGVIVEDKKVITVLNVAEFMVEMTVARPGQEIITISSMEDIVPEIELDASETFDIMIHTSQTNPAPSLTIKVGTQSIDDQFTQTITPNEYTEENGLLSAVKYAVSAEGKVHVDHSYKDGCCAEGIVPGLPSSKVCFKVKFSGFPPMINNTCTRSIMAGNHETDVNFVCSVSSSEPVEVYFIYTRPLEGNETETEKILLGDANTDYHYKASLDEDRDNMLYHVALNMPTAYPQMFTEYTLVVSNTRGNATHSFKLERDMSREPKDTSGSSQLTVAMATMFMYAVAMTLYQS